MKKICLLLALCLMLSILTGCAGEPVETTTTPPETTTAPVETTTAPPETLPPITEPESEVIDFNMKLPEGFEASVAMDGIYVFTSPNAPMDTSVIVVEVLPMDESVLSATKAELTAGFEQMIEDAQTEPTTEPSETTEPTETADPEETTDPAETTEPVETQPAGPQDFVFYSTATMEIDGWPALYCDYSLQYADYSSHVYRFEVVVNYNNYVFTFCDNTDSNTWLDSFEDCVDTIDLILDTEGMELDYSGLEHYKLDCGLNLYAEAGMDTHKAEGFTACLGSRKVILLLMADDKEANNLTDMDLEGYADVLCQTNDLDGFKWDAYGNLSTSFFSTDETGMEYYNVIFVKETGDDFWVCQMACSADNQAAYARAFSLWASSISES